MSRVIICNFNPASRWVQCEVNAAKLRELAKKVVDKRSTYKTKKTKWSSGMFSEPWQPLVYGFAGEVAFYEVFSVWFPDLPKPDLSVQASPNKVDFVYRKCRIEVKTAVNGDNNFIRDDVVDAFDVAVFCRAEPSLIEEETSIVSVWGWSPRRFVEQWKTKAGSRKGWRNHVCHVDDLLPISNLVKYLRTKDDEHRPSNG